MFMSPRMIWDALDPEVRAGILAGCYPEYAGLHRCAKENVSRRCRGGRAQTSVLRCCG
jgi:hypothetical protein